MNARRGVLILVILFLVAAGAMAYVASTLFRTPAPVSRSTVLVWDVPYDLPEANPPARALSMAWTGFHRQRPTVFQVTRAIRRAADDENVRGMVMHVGPIGWGWSRIEEVREALAVFRATGKPLYATLAFGGEREYLLASSARTLAMQPVDPLYLDGLAAGAMFFKGSLDKLGISPNFEHVGEYKSAVEQYTRKDLSPAGRVAEEAVIDDLYGAFLSAAAASREFEPEVMQQLVEAGPYLPDQALEAGLIDTVMYRTNVVELALKRGTKKLAETDFDRYARRIDTGSGPRFALLVASGTIAPGRSDVSPYSGTVVGSETMIESLREIREDGDIEGLILRIDSPGGSVQASDEILAELERCGQEMPIVVTMSDLAASGGYYIAMAADSIVAHRSTQTGSIGIYGGKLNMRGLMEKLGLSIDLFTRGPNATLLSPWADWDENQRRIFHDQLEAHYRKFLGYVAANRGISVDEADSLARGRVWSGDAALGNGLVDANGGFERAFTMIRGLAGYDADETIHIEEYPRVETSWLADALTELFSEEDAYARLPALPRFAQAWIAASQWPAGVPVALMPWCIEAR